MIPTLLLALRLQAPAMAPAPTPSQLAADTARIRDFVRRAAAERNGNLAPGFDNDETPRHDPRWDVRGTRGYRIGDLVVRVDQKSGLVRGLHNFGGGGLNRPGRQLTNARGRPGSFMVPRLVSDDEAQSLARRFFAATGRSYDLVFSNITDGADMDNIFMNFRVTYKGVPTYSGGGIEIDRETGAVHDFLLGSEVPQPPASVLPSIPADEAHLTALRLAVANGVAVEDYDPALVTLSIATLDAVPDPKTSYDYASQDRDDALAGRTRLLYDVKLHSVRYGARVGYAVLVDARDGRPLQVHRFESRTFSAPAKTPIADAPSTPPTNAQAWRVAEGAEPWGKPVIATLTPVPADGFAPGRKILLTDGHLAFQASYDPASERIGVENPDKTYTTYRPGPALAELLRRRTKA